VTRVGNAVKKFKAGDLVGVGWHGGFRTGPVLIARRARRQYCLSFPTLTYNAEDKHLGGVTYGGYSDSIVVDEAFVLRVSEKLIPLEWRRCSAQGLQRIRRCGTGT